MTLTAYPCPPQQVVLGGEAHRQSLPLLPLGPPGIHIAHDLDWGLGSGRPLRALAYAAVETTDWHVYALVNQCRVRPTMLN